MRGNWFVSNKQDIARIEAIQRNLVKETEQLTQLTAGPTKLTAAEFEPLGLKEKDKVIDKLTKILDDRSLADTVKAVTKESGSLSLWVELNNLMRAKSVGSAMALGAGGVAAGVVAGATIGAATRSPLVTALGASIGGMVGGHTGMTISKTFTAEDIVKARKANDDVVKAMKSLKDVISLKMKVCNAMINYLEASVV